MERCLGSLVCLLLDLVCVCLAGYVLRNSNPALLTSHPLFPSPAFPFSIAIPICLFPPPLLLKYHPCFVYHTVFPICEMMLDFLRGSHPNMRSYHVTGVRLYARMSWRALFTGRHRAHGTYDTHTYLYPVRSEVVLFRSWLVLWECLSRV
ncbi:hypothetical protein J3E68DRAFT_273789 [Trichoderma sp. SZMC 28012]